MGKSSVSNVMRAIKNIESDVAFAVQKKQDELQATRSRFDGHYDVVRAGVMDLVKGADTARLGALSAAAAKAGKNFDFENLVAAARARNDQIAQELKYFVNPFGDIATVPDSGITPVAPDGLSAAEIKKRLEEKINTKSSAPQIVKLGKILIGRYDEEEDAKDGEKESPLTVENASAFLEACKKRTFWDYFRPAVYTGRSLNEQKEKGTYDVLEQIAQIIEHRRILGGLVHVENLRDEYVVAGEMDAALRDKALEIFNSAARFEALAPVMGRDVYSEFGRAFADAADAQRDMQAIKPVLEQFGAKLGLIKQDLSILDDIEDLDSSKSLSFDEGIYEASLTDGKSAFTGSFKKVLDELEEIEEEKERQRLAELARQAQASASRSSGSSSGGGGFGGFAGGGGGFGGGGASGSWITCDPDAEHRFHHRRFDI